MSLVRLFFTRELALLTLMLGAATVAAILMVAARVVYTGQLMFAFLVWNLILAWLPFALAVVLQARIQRVDQQTTRPQSSSSFLPRARNRLLRSSTTRTTDEDDQKAHASGSVQYEGGPYDWKCLALAVGWLLFFPNAPYIFTDLVHLERSTPNFFWADLMLILICALIGSVLGLASLRIMHSLVARWWGWIAGWMFVACVAGLASFGVHLGRFVRLNSWDVALAPVTLAREIGGSMVSMLVHPHQVVFPALFAFFLFLAYAMIHAMSRMPHLITVESDGAAPRHCESSAGVSPARPGSPNDAVRPILNHGYTPINTDPNNCFGGLQSHTNRWSIRQM